LKIQIHGEVARREHENLDPEFPSGGSHVLPLVSAAASRAGQMDLKTVRIASCHS